MRNILILITLISGLIFTSLIKNKTRLLDKELLYLDNEINNVQMPQEYINEKRNIICNDCRFFLLHATKCN